jgi:alpha-galactosidase
MPETPRGAEGGGDMASVQEAVHRLLDDIMDRLRQIKPDILIEFRHFESKRSSTPCVRVFGRVRDSPTSQPATGRQRGERCRRCSRS